MMQRKYQYWFFKVIQKSFPNEFLHSILPKNFLPNSALATKMGQTKKYRHAIIKIWDYQRNFFDLTKFAIPYYIYRFCVFTT